MNDYHMEYNMQRLAYIENRMAAANPLNRMTLDEWRTQRLVSLLGDTHRMSKASMTAGTFPIIGMIKNELSHKAYLLTGVTGTGKTYCGYALLHHFSVGGTEDAPITRNIQSVDALTLEEMVLRNDYEGLERLKRVDVLLIDDLGTEANRYKGDDFKAVFNAIFNHRYNHTDKITIITTNISIDELKKSYERVISRIKEIGIVQSAGVKDLRKGNSQ